MREWLGSLAIARVPEVALGIAAGYAFANLADSLAHVPVGVLTEHVGNAPAEARDEFGLLDLFAAPYLLNFEIGGTVISYGEVLQTTLALGLVALVALFVVRRRDRELGACPHCASLIPRESTHCAYCGSGIAPDEP